MLLKVFVTLNIMALRHLRTHALLTRFNEKVQCLTKKKSTVKKYIFYIRSTHRNRGSHRQNWQ